MGPIGICPNLIVVSVVARPRMRSNSNTSNQLQNSTKIRRQLVLLNQPELKGEALSLWQFRFRSERLMLLEFADNQSADFYRFVAAPPTRVRGIFARLRY